MSDAVFATPIKCAALIAANQTHNARNQQEIIFLEIQIFLYAWPIMGQSNLGGQSARQKDAAQITPVSWRAGCFRSGPNGTQGRLCQAA
jgi:hypothetical protein